MTPNPYESPAESDDESDWSTEWEFFWFGCLVGGTLMFATIAGLNMYMRFIGEWR
jgi:hypothetical protein